MLLYMNAKNVIERMGGRAKVIQITGLTRGRISQMIKENHIPKSWETAFRALKPDAFEDKPASVDK